MLLVFPNAVDRKQLSTSRPQRGEQFEVTFAEPRDEDCPWDYDILSFIARAAETYRGEIDGVMSSSDYPGATVAGAIASRLDLPGSSAETIMRCSHKYYSRLAQREAAPKATADFRLVDPKDYHDILRKIDYPCYIKPVKGAFSVMTRQIHGPDELAAFLESAAVKEFIENYVFIFNQLVRELTSFEITGSHFIAEELLRGRQATVEGVSVNGKVEMLGIVDSVKHEGTDSFVRFDYPSSLPAQVQDRMVDVAERVIRQLGLTNSLFNIEMIFDEERDRVSIVEVNPRLCGQFADLYQKVDGINGYQVALAVATGAKPVILRGRGDFRVASSFPLRVFQPVRVIHAPHGELIEEVESGFPSTLIWNECETGQVLSDFERLEDGVSYRYGIVNVGAENRKDLMERLEEVRRRLGYEFGPPTSS